MIIYYITGGVNMIGIISPAKNMQKIKQENVVLSEPIFSAETEEIHNELKKLQPWDFQHLMKVNEQIATQAFLDFQNWGREDSKSAAIFAYDGLVYKNIAASQMSAEQICYVNNHVRILSAFYGLLKSLDGIRPYRLEMACPIKVDGKSLYKFWDRKIADALFATGETIINLASAEYAKAVRKYAGPFDRWIDVEFLTMRNGKLKTIVAWAKMARGQMIRYMTENRVEDPQALKEFEFQGYAFEESLSTEQKYVFVER